MITRRTALAAGLVLPLACAPSAEACTLNPPLGDQVARAVVTELTKAWWQRNREAFIKLFSPDIEDGQKAQTLSLYEKFFAEPAEERSLGQILTRGNACVFEVLESGTKRKSGICDGHPSSLMFYLTFDAARGHVSALRLIDEVLFVPAERRR